MNEQDSTELTHSSTAPVSHGYSPNAKMLPSWAQHQLTACPHLSPPGAGLVGLNQASGRNSSRIYMSPLHDHTQLIDNTFVHTVQTPTHSPGGGLLIHSFRAYLPEDSVSPDDVTEWKTFQLSIDHYQPCTKRSPSDSKISARHALSTLNKAIILDFDVCHGDMTTAVCPPDSPPDLSGSRSSKSSSYCSTSQFSSPDGILSDISNFEDIGLDDERQEKVANTVGGDDSQQKLAAPKQISAKGFSGPTTAHVRPQWDKKRSHPTTRPQVRDIVAQHLKEPEYHLRSGGPSRRGLTSPSVPALSSTANTLTLRTKSTSPVRRQSAHAPLATLSASSLRPTSFSNRSSHPFPTRTFSWQPSRKSVQELEAEYHDSDEDVPDEAALWNVPMSPRPPEERASPMSSTPGSPERRRESRSPKPIPLSHAQTMPESPPARVPQSRPLPRTRASAARSSSLQISTIAELSPSAAPLRQTLRNSRAKSWTFAMSELSEEARVLSEALEHHAEGVEREKESRVQTGGKSLRPSLENRSNRSSYAKIQLPPLQTGELDFLPLSKEKEAILSRTRPSWLPPKNPKEERWHLLQYQRMMAASIEAEKKRESRLHLQRCQKDDTRDALNKVWEMYVSPQRDALDGDDRIRDLWWWGVSSKVRGQVWERAIGNNLGLTHSTYSKALNRAKDIQSRKGHEQSDKEHAMLEWFRDIERDAETAFPELNLFQKHGPLWQDLVDVCEAFACYRSDIGYVYGVQLISALLLLQLPSPAAVFVLLANCLNRPVAQAFLANDQGATSKTYGLAVSTLAIKFPRLHAYLFGSEERGGLAMTDEAIFEPMFRTLFSNGLDVDRLSRVWDCWVFEGDRTLVRTTVALLGCLSSQIYDVGGSVDLKRRNIQEMLGWGPFGRTVQGGYWDLSGMGDVERWMDEVRECGKLDYTGR